MKKLIIGALAAAAVLVSVPAIAQQPAPGAKSPIPKGVFLRGQQPGQFLMRDRLIGAKVVNKEGQVIGDIEDVIMTSDNLISGVIMGVGGFLGAGEKKVGVRYSALVFSSKDGQRVITLPVTKEALAALEPYKRLEPRKSLVERAKEKAKELTDKTKETVKDGAGKVKDAVKK